MREHLVIYFASDPLQISRAFLQCELQPMEPQKMSDSKESNSILYKRTYFSVIKRHGKTTDTELRLLLILFVTPPPPPMSPPPKTPFVKSFPYPSVSTSNPPPHPDCILPVLVSNPLDLLLRPSPPPLHQNLKRPQFLDGLSATPPPPPQGLRGLFPTQPTSWRSPMRGD